MLLASLSLKMLTQKKNGVVNVYLSHSLSLTLSHSLSISLTLSLCLSLAFMLLSKVFEKSLENHAISSLAVQKS